MTPKMDIQTKRIYENPSLADGYRVLVDRLWPRGVKKEATELSEWNKQIAPSTTLRKWFSHKEELLPEFKKRYAEELRTETEELNRLRKIAKKQRLTLLYAARSETLNHAKVLCQLLQSNKFDD